MRADESDPADPPPRVVAGRYTLESVIGVGSSAAVHRARDSRTGRRVAVKLFHLSGGVRDVRQQRREMTTLECLDHPGLVRLRDGGSEDGRPFVVTDLVDGPTLAGRIAEGPLDADEVRALGASLAAALAHVHDSGIVHRDIKPANVLLPSEGRPRLADFGIARLVDGTALTTAGCVVGTAAYLAPEQVLGAEVGPAADVYALGLVLLESLTGRREYPGQSVESANARLHRDPAVPDAVPQDLREVLRAMTAHDPAERPAAVAVAQVLTGRPVPLSGTAPAPAPGRHRLDRHALGGRWGRPAVPRAAAAVLVLVTMAGGVALLAGNADPAPAAPQVVVSGPAAP